MPEEGAESDEAGMGGAGMESEEAGVGGVCQLEPDQDHQVCPVQQEAGPEEGVNGICRMEPETDRQVCSVNPGEGDEVFELDIPPTPPPRPLHTFGRCCGLHYYCLVICCVGGDIVTNL